MSQAETCESCRFFVAMNHGFGHCHKRAPLVLEDSQRAVFPAVLATMFCGDHQKSKSFTDRLQSKGANDG